MIESKLIFHGIFIAQNNLFKMKSVLVKNGMKEATEIDESPLGCFRIALSEISADKKNRAR